MEGGTYHGPRLEQTATQYHNYTFRIVFNDSTHKFDLRLDGSDTGFHRDWGSLWWSSGRPTSVQELLYQCDGGSSENYDLWRQHPNGDWDKWNYTGWNCDMEDYYGYKAVSANDFEVYKPNDAYAPQRSSGCNPWAAPH